MPNKTNISNEAIARSPKTPPIQPQVDDENMDFHDWTPEVVRVLRYEKDALDSKYTRSREMLKEKSFVIDKTKAECEKLERDVRNNLLNYTRAREELEREKEKTAELQGQLRALTTRAESMQRECDQRRLEENCLRQFLKSSQEEIQRLTVQKSPLPLFQSLIAEQNDSSPQLIVSSAVKEISEKYEVAIKQVKILEGDVEHLRVRLDLSKEQTIEMAVSKEEKIAQLEERNRKLELDLDIIRRSKPGLKAALTKVSENYNKSQADLFVEKGTTRKQFDEILTLQNVNDELRMQVKSLQRRIDRLESLQPSSIVKNIKNRPPRPAPINPDFTYQPLKINRKITYPETIKLYATVPQTMTPTSSQQLRDQRREQNEKPLINCIARESQTEAVTKQTPTESINLDTNAIAQILPPSTLKRLANYLYTVEKGYYITVYCYTKKL